MKNDLPFEIDCPEKEKFLDQDDLLKGHDYFASRSHCIRSYSLGHCEGSCKQKFLDETILYLFDSMADNYGFVPYEKKSDDVKEGKRKVVLESVVGFYHDENRNTAFIHWKTNEDLLPCKFKKSLDSTTKIDFLYNGLDYTLIKKGNKTFAFSSELFKKVKELIQLIDYEYPFSITSMDISSNGTLLVFNMDEGSKFIISGLLGVEDFVQEERIRLSKKVDSAEPFFKFEPYKKVDWTKLRKDKGTHFESLCEIILSQQKSIVEIQPIGKTNASDRGRDFIVTEKISSIDGSSQIKWLVQCKYSQDSISPKTIPDWTNRIIEHDLDGYWLVTNNDLTPNLFDQIKDAKKNKRLKIETRIWQRNKFDTFYNTHPELFTKDNFE